jgi:DNA-binding LytR/AlgR family response regulator
MINAIAIDDEPLGLKVIEQFCSQVDFIQLEKTFTKPTEALKHVRKFPVDLLFLDIQMPSLSGIDLYKSIQQDCMVIFTTAHSAYAVESYNLSAVDYLLKPYTFERFLQAVTKAKDHYNYLHQTQQNKPQHFFIRADYSLLKINLPDILLIESLDDYIKIHLVNQKPVVARMTMKAVLEKLPEKEFIRVHRSFIIPVNRIENVRNKVISIAGHEIPVGSSYEENLFRHFKA